jgi:hypothetical protein
MTDSHLTNQPIRSRYFVRPLVVVLELAKLFGVAILLRELSGIGKFLALELGRDGSGD